ncbi:MAG TPA: transcriptional regulator [Leucothrix mucor]|nr:transcriptional regulator [Leucothrix mucor]
MSEAQIKYIIEKHGGTISLSEALRSGIHRSALYALLEKGELERLSRGIYRLTDLPELSDPDLVIVATRVPSAVICLISALSYHELTTQIPHEVNIALPMGRKTPKIDYPPIQPYWFNPSSYAAGIETHLLDGIELKVYDPEKTLVDCFKFRNKIGMDVVLEALKMYRERQRIDVSRLIKYAKICRVKNIITPYLEASL